MEAEKLKHVSEHIRRTRRISILGAIAWFFLPVVANAAEEPSAAVRLGEQLFQDVSLVNPGSRLQTSCATCHHAPSAEEPSLVFSDDIVRSVIPANQKDIGLLTLRNTPSLLDVSADDSYYYDGRYDSLVALITDKLTGPMLGWGDDDRPRVAEQIQALLINDTGNSEDPPYREQFKTALGIDVDAIEADEALEATSKMMATYLESLKSDRTSPWDAFAAINRLPPGPSEGEPIDLFAGRVIGRIENQTARWLLKRPEAFSQLALDGFKIFFKIEGEGAVGNCVVCHIPPTFSDGRFHNTGIAKREYENVNGAGSFARIQIPGAAEAKRPSESFLSIPTNLDPQAVDLGHWNYVDLENSDQRREGETEEAFLERMVGTFKTPRLRNLSSSAPYMHNGAYATLEDTVRQIVRMSAEAQAGTHPNIAEEYRAMRLSEEHVAPLVAFLEALRDQGKQGFREMMIDIAPLDYEELQSL